MAREYHWEEHGDTHAVLYGPEEGMIAAVITMEFGDPELMDGRWKVMSNIYWSLNLWEEDTSISLRQMEKRVIAKLGSELSESVNKLSEDLISVTGLLYETGEKHE